ncbi:helix-turn-helix transcriptional regulator [Erythrobacter sp. YT30]|uniref:helix-turn-helix domain-containing protein n=1 Tax=Erythrobacter sp. YT30 TaxID=1735012 RepID=UPI00076CF57C|nr:helix-turn-helix transcriptional regulator [Erythrobacter sp. YT30]KWV91758.1 hypothetical protein AUC45_11175 [Erythrobacter sp. YT30]
MKLAISKEWCAQKAEAEAGVEIGAGLLGVDPLLPSAGGRVASIDDARIVFGRFVHLNRRKLKLSYEALADQADVEIAELMNIEHDASYEPEPRTIYQLAGAFGVDQRKLMELSGLSKPKNGGYIEDAVRYAARSESLEDLNEEELAALEALVSVLSKKKA